ncbi:MAG TPA: hypothetical protein VLT82_06165 [Myxococcaceae bacterium]|nr:hypothetical protein [Myxococcaceae bacterium]
MTIFALLGWQVLGAVLGAALAVMWKVRGLTLAWGIVSGGVGGVVGGLLARTVLPDGTLFDGLTLAAAGVGAVVAMFIARASIDRQRQGTA